MLFRSYAFEFVRAFVYCNNCRTLGNCKIFVMFHSLLHVVTHDYVTRCRLLRADAQPQPHEASVEDGYARHRDEALAGAVRFLIN